MNYQEALDFIHDTHKFSIKLGLENVSYLLNLMDNPQDKLEYIHVAGTNGKGSTSNFIYQVLMSAGYQVGLYTSPFLETFNERMRINHHYISDEELAEITEFVKSKIELMLEAGLNHPTEFEIVTAIAFEYYRRHDVDYVVLEVGMGGRLDSTNVIKAPLVSVITPVDLDHVEYLGDTIEKVAYEKAGIIKRNCPCVIHPQTLGAKKVIESVANNLEAPLYEVNTTAISVISTDIEGTLFSFEQETYQLKMLGEHQTRNAAVAIETIRVLKSRGVMISDEAIKEGLKEANWVGRLEVISKEPLVIIDGAHNLHGAKGLAVAIKSLLSEYKVIGVVGILGDKDVSGMLETLLPLMDSVICTEPDNPRKMTAQVLSEKVSLHMRAVEVFPSIEKALARGLEKSNEKTALVCFGSLYMIGSARTLLKQFMR